MSAIDANYALDYINSMINSDSNNKMTLLERHEKACNSSNGASCAWLGYSYRYGENVPQNHVKAKKYNEMACNLFNGDGCYLLAHAYLEGYSVVIDKSRARRYFEKGRT